MVVYQVKRAGFKGKKFCPGVVQALSRRWRSKGQHIQIDACRTKKKKNFFNQQQFLLLRKPDYQPAGYQHLRRKADRGSGLSVGVLRGNTFR